MPLVEDLSIYFEDFGYDCVWSPLNGDAQQTGKVLFESVGGGFSFSGVEVNTEELSMVYPVTQFQNLNHDEPLTIDGKDYRVKGEPQAIEDGLLMRAELGIYER